MFRSGKNKERKIFYINSLRSAIPLNFIKKYTATYTVYYLIALRVHPFSTYSKFSEKLTFLTPWDFSVILYVPLRLRSPSNILGSTVSFCSIARNTQICVWLLCWRGYIWFSGYWVVVMYWWGFQITYCSKGVI